MTIATKAHVQIDVQMGAHNLGRGKKSTDILVRLKLQIRP